MHILPERRRPIAVLLSAALLAAGCGGGGATADQRVKRCLDKQPDASQRDCEKWEKAGELEDDGTHEDHESM